MNMTEKHDEAIVTLKVEGEHLYTCMLQWYENVIDDLINNGYIDIHDGYVCLSKKGEDYYLSSK